MMSVLAGFLHTPYTLHPPIAYTCIHKYSKEGKRQVAVRACGCARIGHYGEARWIFQGKALKTVNADFFAHKSCGGFFFGDLHRLLSGRYGGDDGRGAGRRASN